MQSRIISVVQSRWFNAVLFGAVLIFFGSQLRYDELFFSRPSSIHQWRQSDGASLALTFHQDGNSIIEPRIHNQLGDQGQAGGEFPLTYYTVGKLYGLFGAHEWLLRGLHLLIFLAGLFALLWAVLPFFPIRIFALFPLFWFLHSPTLLYYANNFLPDGTGLGLSMLGSALLLAHLRTSRVVWFYSGVVAFMLAALIKVSMLIPFIAFGVIGLWAKLFRGNSEGLDAFRKIRWAFWFMAAAVVFLPALVWYSYISWYNEFHHSAYFRTSTNPIWSLKPDFREYVTNSLHYQWLPLLYSRQTYLLLVLSIALGMVSWVRKGAVVYWFVALVAAGCTAYTALFFDAFDVHDYYQLPFLLFALSVFICAGRLATEWLHARHNAWVTACALVILAAFSWWSAETCRKNFKSQYMQKFMHELTLNPHFNDIEPFLEANGIGRDKKVISLPESSSNISLYLMNRKGWTGLTGLYNTDDADSVIKRGAEYAVISDTSFYSITYLKYHITDTIGYHGNIGVYKIEKSRWADF